MQILKRIGILTLIIIGMALFMKWSIWHDEQIMKAADVYEKCVVRVYGKSPAHIYVETGEYPECVNINN